MYAIYSALYLVAVFLLLLPQYLKRPKAFRRGWLRNKFGLFPSASSMQSRRPIWFHAVSVGEVHAVLPLLKKVRATYPDLPLVLSTITDTGQKVARERSPAGTLVIYLPFDLRCILKRCFARVMPRLLVVVETELWPNAFRAADEQGVPVIVLNGRISERSSRGYARVSFFMKRVFDHVALFCMQTEADAARIRQIGAHAERVRVTGNFKFDMDLPEEMPPWLGHLRGPVLVAGSTHAGEEQIVIDAWRENTDRFPGLKLIIAPRHPERFGQAEETIRKAGMPYRKRSDLAADGRELDTAEPLIVLLDSVGELSVVYRAADIAIMGKSFAGFGGQNPLEPAYWGIPVLCGPHMENFPFISDFLDAGAAFAVTENTLARKIKELLIQPDKAKAAGEKARSLYLKNSGAVERSLRIVGDYLGTA